MSVLLVLADDLTGAIDTGVQFAAQRADTAVYHEPLAQAFDCQAQVLVINTQTRNLDAPLAYAQVKQIALSAKQRGITRIFKKTDSGMRGNVGAELQAVLDVFGATLAFAPAHPKIGRQVIEGQLFVDGVPVSRSVFGKDPFKPVLRDDIPGLIAQQSPVSVVSAAGEGTPPPNAVWLFDAASTEDLERAAQVSFQAGCSLYAGCAGFAEALMPLMGLVRQAKSLPAVALPMFVVSGSVSDVTFKQLRQALSDGWRRAPLEAAELLSPQFAQQPAGERWAEAFAERMMAGERMLVAAALDAAEAKRVGQLGTRLGMSLEQIKDSIAGNLGALCAQVLRRVPAATPAIIGGDTLYTALSALQTGRITPLTEISAGTVLSRILTPWGAWPLISKSGSFGNQHAIEQMSAYLRRHQEQPA